MYNIRMYTVSLIKLNRFFLTIFCFGQRFRHCHSERYLYRSRKKLEKMILSELDLIFIFTLVMSNNMLFSDKGLKNGRLPSRGSQAASWAAPLLPVVLCHVRQEANSIIFLQGGNNLSVLISSYHIPCLLQMILQLVRSFTLLSDFIVYPSEAPPPHGFPVRPLRGKTEKKRKRENEEESK